MPLQDTLSNVENQTAHDNTATYSALAMARVVILSMAIIELLVKTKNKMFCFYSALNTFCSFSLNKVFSSLTLAPGKEVSRIFPRPVETQAKAEGA